MISRYQPPPILKAIEHLLVDVERVVRGFARGHRYMIGADLRRQTMLVWDIAQRAASEPEARTHWLAELKRAAAVLSQYLRTAKLAGAFARFKQFEHLIRQAEAIERQVGGWKRQWHSKVQSAQGREAVAQRDQKLSTRAASAGANA